MCGAMEFVMGKIDLEVDTTSLASWRKGQQACSTMLGIEVCPSGRISI